MKKIVLASITLFALSLSACSFSFNGKTNEEKTIVDFVISDSNVNSYHENSIYATSNGLEVTAIRQNGTTLKVQSKDYSYKLYNSSHLEHNPNDIFGETGIFTVEVSYSTFTNKTLSFTVNEYVPVTSIIISQPSIEINKGQTYQLTATILPSNATNINVTWYSSNTNVATVDQTGLVTGLSEGSSEITATSVDSGLSAKVNVTVTAPIFEKVDLLYTYDDVQQNNYYTLDSMPNTGSPKVIIIPVWFTDSKNYISTAKKDGVKNDIYNAFALNKSSVTGWYSVADYYRVESSGALTLDFVMSDWYTPGVASSSMTDEGLTMQMVKDATDWYFDGNTALNRKDYDSNGDGYIDGVMLIYAAPDYRTTSSPNENLWAYCYYVQEGANKVEPVPNVFFWASYDFLYGNNATSRTGFNYAGGDTSYCTLDTHTYIHETGHMFGLDDYYDYSSNAYELAAAFSMQDYNVGGHDPYSLMALGWVDPYVPTDSCAITIKPFQSSHDVILLKNNFTSNSPFDEYLLVELYTPTGLNYFDSEHQYRGNYPLGPSETGIRLWHVDARLVKASNYAGGFSINNITTNPTQGRYGVCHAFSNTTADDSGHTSPLGSSYYDYHLLHLIRNNVYATNYPKDSLTGSSLFKNGSSFSMNTYSSQFVKGNKMNDGTSLGWSFSVSITGVGENAEATINLVKA